MVTANREGLPFDGMTAKDIKSGFDELAVKYLRSQ